VVHEKRLYRASLGNIVIYMHHLSIHSSILHASWGRCVGCSAWCECDRDSKCEFVGSGQPLGRVDVGLNECVGLGP
jgi:hypothetical protein